jgi:hypothetical protein
VSGLDARAIGFGAGVAIAIAVPVATAGSAIADDGSSALGVLFALVALVGFGVGGWIAGSRQPASPLLHGAVAGVVAAAVAQAAAAGVAVADDRDVSAAAVAVNALLATSVGLTGGWLADRQRRPPTTLDPRP